MSRHEPFDRCQTIVGRVHHVMSGSPVNVNVDQPGRENPIAKVKDQRALRNRQYIAPANGRYHSVFDYERSILDPLQRRQQLPSCEDRLQLPTLGLRLLEF